MVSSLRKKFVIITMALMLGTFSLFLVVQFVYNDYWNTMDMADFLAIVADSGVLLQEADSDIEDTILDMTEGDNAIVGVVVDPAGIIVSKKVLGDDNVIEIPEDVIRKILSYGDEKIRVGPYIYAYRNLENNRRLIVLMDSRDGEEMLRRVPGTIALIAIGVVVLMMLTFYLSGYVTEPARRALEREKRFVSDASHELKTPLGAISINAQALNAEAGDSLYLRNIISESERMTRLIERLLTLAKMEEDTELVTGKLSLSELSEEMALTYESLAFEGQIDYRYHIDEHIEIVANEDEIRQLLAILIDNAIKNTPQKGKIHILCRSEKTTAVLKVINTGEGISEEDLPHVFERFYTSDRTGESSSFGLGLAIAKAIVERAAGTIRVESVPAGETIFTVSFPGAVS